MAPRGAGAFITAAAVVGRHRGENESDEDLWAQYQWRQKLRLIT